MTTERKTQIENVTLTLRRPNEYTSWRPRIEREYPWFGAVRWGVFHLTWEKGQKPWR